MRAIAGILLVVSIFGVVFGAGPELALWFKSRSWQPGEATILKVVGAAKTKNSITEVHYRYEARGGLHESTRVYLSPRWMPGGEVLAEWEKRFIMAQQQSRPMRLWISPQDPEDAVFVRDLNWPAMSPLLGGAGLGILLGLVGLFWPSRAALTTIPTAEAAPVVATHTANPAIPSAKSSDTQTPAEHELGILAITRAEGGLCVELQGKPGVIEVVESATIDRLDAQSIVRWQDALPLNVLTNKGRWHVRCALPRTGIAATQAREHGNDRWQVTFRLRSQGRVARLSQILPAQWWGGA